MRRGADLGDKAFGGGFSFSLSAAREAAKGSVKGLLCLFVCLFIGCFLVFSISVASLAAFPLYNTSFSLLVLSLLPLLFIYLFIHS